VRRTHSRHGLKLLNGWERELPKFVQVVPLEMIGKLEHPTTIEEEAKMREAGE
jgi:glutamate synthase domain-containing protein 3